MTPLPDTKQNRDTFPVTPERARVMLVGTPGAGKTTLAASWAPNSTLIIDTQGGTVLLDGEHYVSHIHDWPAFMAVVDELVAGGHKYKTVAIDLIDDIWNFADAHYAGKNAVLASATDDYQKAIRTAEGMFRQTVGKLLASDLGVWMIGHAREKQEGNLTRYQAKLDARALTYVQGACQFIFLAETLGPRRALHTQPSARFEAKSRVPMPDPMDLDARALRDAMDRGLNPAKYTKTKTNPELVTA